MYGDSLSDRPARVLSHAVLALCERLDELSCLVAVPEYGDE
jgi:hypothetical protein